MKDIVFLTVFLPAIVVIAATGVYQYYQNRDMPNDITVFCMDKGYAAPTNALTIRPGQSVKLHGMWAGK